MIALLIIESDKIGDLVTIYLKPLGFDVVRYTNPLKALDNLDEIHPHVIVCSAQDFPRHWKPIIQVLREKRSKEDAVFILLKGQEFSFDEASKALHLGVNGAVREDLEDPRERSRFQKLIARYIGLDDQRRTDRYIPVPGDRLAFMFTHPGNSCLVMGKIEDISESGMNFKPDNRETTADLETGITLRECSLRIGESIITLNCSVARNNLLLGLRFLDFRGANKALLGAYLRSIPERHLEAAMKRTDK
jgi:hypothetical protein